MAHRGDYDHTFAVLDGIENPVLPHSQAVVFHTAELLRTAWPGIVTGGLVAVARIAGETAPLIFTAFGNLNFKTNIMEPMQALPLQIYVYATGPFEEWHRLAWGAALVLLGIVLVVGLLARYVTRNRFRNA